MAVTSSSDSSRGSSHSTSHGPHQGLFLSISTTLGEESARGWMTRGASPELGSAMQHGEIELGSESRRMRRALRRWNAPLSKDEGPCQKKAVSLAMLLSSQFLVGVSDAIAMDESIVPNRVYPRQGNMSNSKETKQKERIHCPGGSHQFSFLSGSDQHARTR